MVNSLTTLSLLGLGGQLLVWSSSTIHAYVVVVPTRYNGLTRRHPITAPVDVTLSPHPSRTSPLYSMEEESDETAIGDEEDTTAPSAEDELEEVVEEEEEEEPEPKEDPEIVALKEEISKLESQVKEKKRQAMDIGDRADEFTQAGYQRKVAEMENMRRARSSLNSSNKFAATASVLAEFLPTLDKLRELQAKYGETEFGKKYDALPGTLKAGFTEMGAEEFTASVGEPIDKSKMIAIESEYSEEFPADTVLRPIKVGMEIKGNVIRMAECVVSLGPEKTEEEEAPEERAEEEEAAAEE